MKKARYLFPSDYMADPSVHVFNDKLYIYPSHDWDSGAAFDDDGGHFEMKDYHALTLTDIENEEATDCGKILDCRIFHGQADSCGTMMSLRKTVSIILSSAQRTRTMCSTSEWLLLTDRKVRLSRRPTTFADLTR